MGRFLAQFQRLRWCGRTSTRSIWRISRSVLIRAVANGISTTMPGRLPPAVHPCSTSCVSRKQRRSHDSVYRVSSGSSAGVSVLNRSVSTAVHTDAPAAPRVAGTGGTQSSVRTDLATCYASSSAARFSLALDAECLPVTMLLDSGWLVSCGAVRRCAPVWRCDSPVRRSGDSLCAPVAIWCPSRAPDLAVATGTSTSIHVQRMGIRAGPLTSFAATNVPPYNDRRPTDRLPVVECRWRQCRVPRGRCLAFLLLRDTHDRGGVWWCGVRVVPTTTVVGRSTCLCR